ncbi:PREDICTED: carboxymethylenebutenolidase homolog [Elephantulus edwardii]|uniref:carboxymethylenebutenolidase homolog n=1 Tax=Elephantulus edwardii TaxID=28737 RepID=UPI0003F0ED30|nr:PREDICTED: carboxymethylenebutenolidase homolog [Elephantulus edwardii]
MANEAAPCPCDIGHRMEYGGQGCVVQVEHIRAYLSKPPVDTGKAVVVIQDIFGWQLPNTRYMADMIAANGYTTVVPDFFVGQEPWSPSSDWSTFPEWLKTRDARKVDSSCLSVRGPLASMTGSDRGCLPRAVSHGPPAPATSLGIVKDSEDVYALRKPTLFIFAENDAVIPLQQVSLLTQKLKAHCRVDHQIKTFSGQTHGFVHRKREDVAPADKPYIEEARRNLLEWLSKYV